MKKGKKPTPQPWFFRRKFNTACFELKQHMGVKKGVTMTTAYIKKYYYTGIFTKKTCYWIFWAMHLFALLLWRQDYEAMFTSFLCWLNTNTSLDQCCTLQAQSSLKLILFVTPVEKTNTQNIALRLCCSHSTHSDFWVWKWLLFT